MRHRIGAVEALQSPILRVTFDDGLVGELDCSKLVGAPAYPELRDPAFFAAVAVGEGGWSFGWRLDQLGQEIDLCPDAARIDVETRLVEDLAARHRAALAAAE